MLGIGLDLERVQAIAVFSSEPQPSRPAQIRRQKQWPPAFVLADMNVFVIPHAMQPVTGLAKDRMAQRHAGNAESFQRRRNKSTVKLETATSPPDFTARHQTECTRTQSDQRVRRRPAYEQKFDEALQTNRLSAVKHVLK